MDNKCIAACLKALTGFFALLITCVAADNLYPVTIDNNTHWLRVKTSSNNNQTTQIVLDEDLTPYYSVPGNVLSTYSIMSGLWVTYYNNYYGDIRFTTLNLDQEMITEVIALDHNIRPTNVFPVAFRATVCSVNQTEHPLALLVHETPGAKEKTIFLLEYKTNPEPEVIHHFSDYNSTMLENPFRALEYRTQWLDCDSQGHLHWLIKGTELFSNCLSGEMTSGLYWYSFEPTALNSTLFSESGEALNDNYQLILLGFYSDGRIQTISCAEVDSARLSIRVIGNYFTPSLDSDDTTDIYWVELFQNDSAITFLRLYDLGYVERIFQCEFWPSTVELITTTYYLDEEQNQFQRFLVTGVLSANDSQLQIKRPYGQPAPGNDSEPWHSLQGRQEPLLSTYLISGLLTGVFIGVSVPIVITWLYCKGFGKKLDRKLINSSS